MRIDLSCYPCILGQVAKLAGEATGDKDEQLRLVRRFLQMTIDSDEVTSPPELAANFHAAAAQISGIADPLDEAKDRATELGLRLLPELRKLRENHRDPFEAAIRLAIGGNIIDYGVNPHFELASAEEQILQVFDLPLDLGEVERLRAAVKKAKKIFFLLDNCGEAVIDNVLIDFFREKAVIGVRGRPIFNDVTRREAECSGFSGMEIFDTGDNSPGVVPRRTSPEFLAAMRSCDLVIAKGQGNFETLDDYPRPIFHLLRVKCNIISSVFGAPIGSLQICGRNLEETRP